MCTFIPPEFRKWFSWWSSWVRWIIKKRSLDKEFNSFNMWCQRQLYYTVIGRQVVPCLYDFIYKPGMKNQAIFFLFSSLLIAMCLLKKLEAKTLSVMNLYGIPLYYISNVSSVCWYTYQTVDVYFSNAFEGSNWTKFIEWKHSKRWLKWNNIILSNWLPHIESFIRM